MLENEKQKLNEVETEKVSGGENENIKVPYDMGMDVDIPGIDRNPKHKYKCSDCGYKFWFRQPGSPDSCSAIMVRCPNCDSTNVDVVKN
ncbi:MAG: hypothetical protein Q4D57_02355 [Clostridia bacterium]|nr:hypothetical protein [Clostridia bacterium]